MNKIYLTFFAFAVFLVLVSSCKPEDDPDPIPTDPRDKIVDTWRCDENSQVFDKSMMTIYTVSISVDDASTDMVVIDNFYQLGANNYIKAVLSGTDLTISGQVISGHTVNGTGLITDNFKKISWTYFVNDGSGEIDTCTAVYTPAF